jgi:hypothetical protein
MKRELSHDDEEDDEKEEQSLKHTRLYRLRDDFLSKIRSHAGAGVFTEIVKYLTLAEAYSLSRMDPEINLYFHKRGVWKEYVQEYLRKNFRLGVTVLVSMFHLPQNQQPNYLWMATIFKQYQHNNTFDFRYVDNDVEVLILNPNLLQVSFSEDFPTEKLTHMLRYWESVNLDYRRGHGYHKINVLFTIDVKGCMIFQVMYSLMQLGFYLKVRLDRADYYIRSQLKC